MILTVLVMAVGFFASQVFAESIYSYSTLISVHEDASFTVREKIIFDFESSDRHGIYRDIPTTYTTALGLKKSIRINNIDVVDESGEKYQFDVSNDNGIKKIKIGDPNAFVNGRKTYIVTYDVANAISYFDNIDEVYWNVIGNNWNVPIQFADVIVSLPRVLDFNEVQSSCYKGVNGSTDECSPAVFKTEGMHTEIRYQSPIAINPYESFTVAVGFPKGIVKEPSVFTYIAWFLIDNWFVLLPMFVFILMFRQWKKHGDDPEGKGVIIPQYDVPNDLNTLEVAGIVKQRISSADISAHIISLAVKGNIKIEALEIKNKFLESQDYILHKLQEPTTQIDKVLMDKIFNGKNEIKVSSLTNVFYKEIPDITKQVFAQLVDKGFYENNPETVRAKYISLAVVGGFIVIFFSGFLGEWWLVSIGVSAAIVILFSFIMPKKTMLGVTTKEYLLGLKQYLQIAEKDRLIFHNAPEKKPEIFEKLLPVAMVMGVASIWAKEFEDIYTKPPEWYSGYHGSFIATDFANNLSSFTSTTSSTLSSAPRNSGSGGGGSSGGGFGGGGGGSW